MRCDRSRSMWILVLALSGCAPSSDEPHCPDPAPWQALLSAHLERYHGFEVSDALKLLQQATTGSEHAVPDSASAAAWMDREWAALGNGPAEPVIDTLGGDGRFVRVHLRPFRDRGGDPARLTAAFVATANATHPDTALLRCAIEGVITVVPWDSAQWRTEANTWRRAGYPAMHHSPGYEAAHRPAYRVVAREHVAALVSEPRR
jgi:hypothetical protein